MRQQSRAIPVKLLQRLLNKNGALSTLAEDGIFGPKTHEAVVAFQARQGIHPDGVVGPATWPHLGLRIETTHSVRQFGQPTGMTCWSAAATMILGNMSVGPGGAALAPSGGMGPGPDNIRRFGDSLGWRMHYPQTWSVTGLANMLRRTRLGRGWCGRRRLAACHCTERHLE